MTLVIDASVAVKWVIEEEGSTEAEALLLSDQLIAPDLLLVECANVLWTKVRRRLMTRDKAQVGMAILKTAPVRFFLTSRYVEGAQQLAFELDKPVYDSVYLALCLEQGATLVTADQAFVGAVQRHGGYAAAIRPLQG